MSEPISDTSPHHVSSRCPPAVEKVLNVKSPAGEKVNSEKRPAGETTSPAGKICHSERVPAGEKVLNSNQKGDQLFSRFQSQKNGCQMFVWYGSAFKFQVTGYVRRDSSQTQQGLLVRKLCILYRLLLLASQGCPGISSSSSTGRSISRGESIGCLDAAALISRLPGSVPAALLDEVSHEGSPLAVWMQQHSFQVSLDQFQRLYWKKYLMKGAVSLPVSLKVLRNTVI